MTSQSKLDQLIDHCDTIAGHLPSVPAEVSQQLEKDCKQLVESAKLINAIAGEFAFEGLTDNGFAIYLTLVTSYVRLIALQIEENKLDHNLLKLAKLVFFYRDWLLSTSRDLQNEKETLNGKEQHLILKKTNLRLRFLYELINLDDDAVQLKYSTYNAFWLPPDIKRMMKFLSLIFAVRYKPPFTLSALFSDKSLGKICEKLFRTPNLDYPFDVWQTSENWFVCNLINFFANLKVPVKSRTLRVPKQKRIRLDYKGNILDFDAMTSEEIDEYAADEEEQKRQKSQGKRFRNRNTIRCRLSCINSKSKMAESLERVRTSTTPKISNCRTVSRPSDPLPNANHLDSDGHLNPENKLILFIHGGAFLTQGSKSYELFLRKIVNQLGSVPILAVDYSLTVPYPIPLQELMDVYLWLTSGADEVERKIGFHPQQIILSGDSCGGFLAITLTIALNELNKMLRKSAGACKRPGSRSIQLPIRLPQAIVAEYPALALTNISPSISLTVFDSLVDCHLFMLAISVYGANLSSSSDFKTIEKGERYQKIAAKNEGQFTEQNDKQNKSQDSKNNEDDSLPWYSCDYATYVNRADYIDSFYSHPFINPLLYEDKFEELKEVALYVLAGTADFVMDHSIELARLWKGKVSLDLFEQTTHGFMQFAAFSAESREALQMVIRRHQEACFLN